MLYIHENNLTNKIANNYKSCGTNIQEFYQNKYLPMRNSILSLQFDEENITNFEIATNIFNNYYQELIEFSNNNGITSQSKFASTFLEEISAYLFKDLPDIISGTFGVYNKGIYAGLKIDKNRHIDIIKKDVDFCIGKKVNVTIDGQTAIKLILPIVAVEVKTYLDATMFGEVKSSSKAIKSASPNSKTYVLMGYKCIAPEHIIAARQDSALDEIFVLRADENSKIDYNAVYEYWKEITDSINQLTSDVEIHVPGRLLKP